VLWSGALFAAGDTGSRPRFRLLPVMALWANLQGSCIDGRAELYGYRFLSGYLAAERGDEPALTGLLARYGITWTLLMPQQGAVSRLDGLPGWRRVYTDAEAVIHMRLAARSGWKRVIRREAAAGPVRIRRPPRNHAGNRNFR